MKKLGVALAMTIAAVGAAHAADLPTKKEAAPPLPPNCFSSIWAFMDSTAADCPLSYGPLTFYATLDLGLQYESNGAAWSPTQPNGTASFINKQAYGSKWLWSPNNLSQSVVGLKLSQPVAYGWSVVGTVEIRISTPILEFGQRRTLPGPEQRQGATDARLRRGFGPRRPMG